MKRAAPILVSACLLGMRTRYDGGHAESPDVLALCRGRPVIPVCPEQLGGLPTPREPARMAGGAGAEVLAGEARLFWHPSLVDVTEAFLRGAREVAALVEKFGIREAYLKARSPSCGVGSVSVGETVIPGDGVTASLLRSLGLTLVAVEKGESASP